MHLEKATEISGVHIHVGQGRDEIVADQHQQKQEIVHQPLNIVPFEISFLFTSLGVVVLVSYVGGTDRAGRAPVQGARRRLIDAGRAAGRTWGQSATNRPPQFLFTKNFSTSAPHP